MKTYYVYILTNSRHTSLYVGVTNSLVRRVGEHKSKLNVGFTSRYNVDQLVYFETFNNIVNAIKREKQLKNLVRRKKILLINEMNPEWIDLSRGML